MRRATVFVLRVGYRDFGGPPAPLAGVYVTEVAAQADVRRGSGEEPHIQISRSSVALSDDQRYAIIHVGPERGVYPIGVRVDLLLQEAGQLEATVMSEALRKLSPDERGLLGLPEATP